MSDNLKERWSKNERNQTSKQSWEQRYKKNRKTGTTMQDNYNTVKRKKKR